MSSTFGKRKLHQNFQKEIQNDQDQELQLKLSIKPSSKTGTKTSTYHKKNHKKLTMMRFFNSTNFELSILLAILFLLSLLTLSLYLKSDEKQKDNVNPAIQALKSYEKQVKKITIESIKEVKQQVKPKQTIEQKMQVKQKQIIEQKIKKETIQEKPNQKNQKVKQYLVSNKMQSTTAQQVFARIKKQGRKIPKSYKNGNQITQIQRFQSSKFVQLKNQGHQDLAFQEYNYYESKYQISQYKQLPFCIVIPSYQNVKNNRYKKNIDSIIQQNYSNYHVVFIDDLSPDKTGEVTQKYIEKFDQTIRNKIKIIIKSQHLTALPNLVYAANHQCKEDQIYVIVDGDDQLIGRQVLKLLNAYYQQTGAWLVYTSHLWHTFQTGYSSYFPQSVIKANSYRQYAHYYLQHLRSFYTKLFNLVEDKDLRDKKGQYYKVTYDMAMFYPMLEMSQQNFQYFPQITYLYDFNTGLNDAKIRGNQQRAADQQIRKKLHYKPLTELFPNIQQK